MLAELARLTALDESSPQSFKVRAYENAIHGIEDSRVRAAITPELVVRDSTGAALIRA